MSGDEPVGSEGSVYHFLQQLPVLPDFQPAPYLYGRKLPSAGHRGRLPDDQPYRKPESDGDENHCAPSYCGEGELRAGGGGWVKEWIFR